jgi:hypothetical protein
MTEILTAEELRGLLSGFAAAIELDQIRVDALPRERFHPLYSPGMWRRWRRDHLDYINQLLPTLSAMPVALLQELTQIALTYDPTAVRERMLDLFAEAVSGSCSAEAFETASLFFGWLVKYVSGRSKPKPTYGEARTMMMQWVTVTDPLRITEDPECGYGQPAGFVS